MHWRNIAPENTEIVIQCCKGLNPYAMTGVEKDGARSIAKTDAALGIRQDLLK